MPEDNIVCFQNPGKPLLVKAGDSRHWMINLSSVKLNYKLKFENPNSSFSIKESQLEGEIAERGQILLDFTRKPGRAQDDKLTVEYTGPITGKTVIKVVPVE